MPALPGLDIPLDLPPMEARLVDAVPDAPGWSFEPKWDGFRCLAFRSQAGVDLRAKSGKPLTRYFPDMAETMAALKPARFVLDGELVIPVDGAFSFDALQLRLHPAESRVRKLAAANPAVFVAFDCLADETGASLLDQPLQARRAVLQRIVQASPTPPVQLTPYTDDAERARAWLAQSGDGELDGVVCKRLDDAYRPGERAMLKVKRQRTADCVVGGFRLGQDSDLVGSLLLGLYDDEGRLDHVGFTSQIAAADKPALTRRLQALAPGPGFTGRSPGGPSRWNTERSGEYVPLRHELVAEVGFDQVTGARLRHGARLIRFRPDKAPRQCTLEQIAPPKTAASLALG